MSSFYVTQARIVPVFKVFERARVVCKTGVIHVWRGPGAALQQQPCLYRHLQRRLLSACRCRSPLGDRSRLIPSVNGCFNICQEVCPASDVAPRQGSFPSFPPSTLNKPFSPTALALCLAYRVASVESVLLR